ncbi:DUF3558 family protein [Rhizomonospora bruguierae]|uniref:DUF3558 family protein n=1 Tax=Rhizomonospora bruguierae TaxID=1581705 RepID=UPI001BD0433B|nr:DUF3558 family protein [Micromonospora sp. NBRC 107566]
MSYLRHAPRAAAATLACVALAALTGCGDDGKETAAPPAAATTAPATDAPAGEPTATAAAASDVDPCTLLVKKEAEKLAGTALEDGVRVQESCTYTGPVTGPTAQVEIYVGDGAKKFLDIDRDNLGHKFETLAGIGDEAYLEDGVAFVNKSGVWVAIRLTRLEDWAKFVKPMEEAVRTVAGRL